MLIATEHNDPHCHNPKFPFSQPILAIFRKVNRLCHLDFFVDYLVGGNFVYGRRQIAFSNLCFFQNLFSYVSVDPSARFSRVHVSLRTCGAQLRGDLIQHQRPVGPEAFKPPYTPKNHLSLYRYCTIDTPPRRI